MEVDEGVLLLAESLDQCLMLLLLVISSWDVVLHVEQVGSSRQSCESMTACAALCPHPARNPGGPEPQVSNSWGHGHSLHKCSHPGCNASV